MKQFRFLTVTLACSWLLLSACSSDDSNNSENQNIEVLRPLDVAADQLNQRLEGLDFKDLDPLAETVASATRADGEASEFDVKLSTLLTLLKGEEGKGVTMGRRFSYDAFNTALELAYDLSVILKDNGESSSSWFRSQGRRQGRGDLYRPQRPAVSRLGRDGKGYLHLSLELLCHRR